MGDRYPHFPQPQSSDHPHVHFPWRQASAARLRIRSAQWGGLRATPYVAPQAPDRAATSTLHPSLRFGQVQAALLCKGVAQCGALQAINTG